MTAIEAPAPSRALFWTIVPPIALPVFLAAADGTVVATALPAIGASLGHVELLSWVIVANLIAGTIAAPAYGRLGDLFGRRRMMLVSLAVFQGAALLCAASGGMGMLLGARVLQGLGGGGLMTLAQALIGQHVPARARGSYQGYLAGCIVAGSGFGPVAGGMLTQAFGWQAVFLAYIPVGLAAMVLVARLPSDARHGGPVSVDGAGMLLLAASVVPLLIAVSRLQRPDPSSLPLTFGIGAVAVAMGAALVWQQRRVPNPVLALPLLRHPAFWRSDAMSFCSGASLTAMVTFLPIYFEIVLGASPGQAGLMLLPLTLSVSSGSVLTGWLISRTGRTAVFPACGLAVTAASLVALALWAPVMGQTALAATLAIGGLCQGSAMLTAQVTVQIVTQPRQLGAAAGSVQLARALGSAIGAAVAGAVLFGLLAVQGSDAVALFAAMLRRGPDALAELPALQRARIGAEITAAFRGVFLTVACFSCAIVAAAWTMPVRRLER
ncbi:MAG TPA: MFS transporter [Acetobacteraceae bacterium]|nr:MFS transporter [Acetobacteraceae bacterium]